MYRNMYRKFIDVLRALKLREGTPCLFSKALVSTSYEQHLHLLFNTTLKKKKTQYSDVILFASLRESCFSLVNKGWSVGWMNFNVGLEDSWKQSGSHSKDGSQTCYQCQNWYLLVYFDEIMDSPLIQESKLWDQLFPDKLRAESGLSAIAQCVVLIQY